MRGPKVGRRVSDNTRRPRRLTLCPLRLEDRTNPVSFADPVGYAGGNNDVVAADFNGDGVPDAACTTGNSVFVYLGTGGGTLAAGVNYPLGASGVDNRVRTADLTGDGKLDLIVGTNIIDAKLVVFPGNGDGTFQAPVTATLGPTSASTVNDVTVADFNGDGKNDVAIATEGQGMAVLLNDGSAAILAAPTYYAPGANPGSGGVDAADVNGDGKIDLAYSSFVAGAGQLNVYLNQGGGTFALGKAYPNGTTNPGVGSHDAVVAKDTSGKVLDFNGDGKADVAAGWTGNGFVAAYLGNGDGTFQAPNTFPSGGLRVFNRMAAADLDLDGRTDLLPLIANGGATVVGFQVLLGTGPGQFAAPQTFGNPGFSNLAGITATDMNADGLPDVLGGLGLSPGTLNVALNTTNQDSLIGSFLVSAPTPSVAGVGFDVTVTARDFKSAVYTGYTGTVQFTSTDPQATAGAGLPANYTFVAADNGVHTFSNVTLKTAGAQSITVADTTKASAKGSAGVTVTPAAPASVVAISGSGQTAAVTAAFASPLVAQVFDPFGNAVPGVTITFTGPASGAAATFPSGSTPTSDAAGKVSVPVAANTVAGKYAVAAAAAGAAKAATFQLTNTPGAPAAVVADSGSGQSATVNTAYAQNPTVRVVDAFDNPVSGVTVTFAGPATGAGVTFPGGTQAVSGAAGTAAVPVNANTKAGAVTVSATAPGIGTPATFALTNTAGAPVVIVPLSGGGQSAKVNTTFANPLVARVLDAFGNRVPGATVTFTGPTTGAGASFPGGSAPATDANGQVSLAAKANTVVGAYDVKATVAGVANPVSFALTNTVGNPTTIFIVSGNNQSARIQQPFVDPVVRVTDAFGNPVPGIDVSFDAPPTGAGVTFPAGSKAVTDAAGNASVPMTANGAAGTYPVYALATGVGTLAELTLTNLLPPATLIGAPQFAAGGPNGTVRFFNPDGTQRFGLAPFAGFTGQVRTAAGDFNGDGVADLVVGTGPGSATRVRILDGASQALLFSLDPFEPAFTGGIFVAAGDLTGDGRADLAISPDEGGGPRVRVFSGNGFTQIADFFGIDDPNFRGGARAAFGDLNGDDRADLLVAAGFGGGPRLAAFDGAQLGPNGGPKLFGDFFVFEQTLRNGIFIAAGDLNGDGFGDVVAGGGPGGGPRVYALSGKNLVQSGTQTQLANFFAGDVNSRGGIRVAVKNLDADGRADLVTGAGTGAGTRVTGYLGINTPVNGTPPEQFGFDAFAGLTGGVFVG